MATRILGIESSCDETAAAVVGDGKDILSNVVASQNSLHEKYGGVVPELASREHLRQIVPVVREALAQARMSYADVDAIAVTCGPGLVGSLLVGMTYGKALASELSKPLIAVNHLEGHVYAVFLEAHIQGNNPILPAVCLIVSGGHTLLYHVQSAKSDMGPGITFAYRRLGGTRDDAAGEAYDKVARLLALGYPGGPVIDALAAHPFAAGPASGDDLRFGPIKMSGNALDFSFSGIKTAVLYYLRDHPELAPEIEVRRKALSAGTPKPSDLLPLCSPTTLALIRNFQEAVVRDLVTRTLAAAEQLGCPTMLVSGGVAANSELRARFAAAQVRPLEVFFPSRALCTDNAAMIAAAAYPRLLARQFAPDNLNAEANLRLS